MPPKKLSSSSSMSLRIQISCWLSWLTKSKDMSSKKNEQVKGVGNNPILPISTIIKFLYTKNKANKKKCHQKDYRVLIICH